MDSDKPPVGNDVSPVEVWEQLNSDLRESAIRLLAQMVYKIVAAEIERTKPNSTEINYVQSKCAGNKEHSTSP